MQKNLKKNRQNGFSFLEVMFVVFILGTALTVFVQVISKSIDHSAESRDTIIAASLAQEGVELVRNIRDNNWAKAKTDPTKTAFSDINDGNWRINYNNDALLAWGETAGMLYIDGNSCYSQSAGSPTKFRRKIGISSLGETKVVTSMVVWERSDYPSTTTSCNAANKCIYAEIILTKWGS
jgi:prepilin-type N-terminal cleavage/methylation domain-containing protein